VCRVGPRVPRPGWQTVGSGEKKDSCFIYHPHINGEEPRKKRKGKLNERRLTSLVKNKTASIKGGAARGKFLWFGGPRIPGRSGRRNTFSERVIHKRRLATFSRVMKGGKGSTSQS